jgi:hypothetical protein
MTTQAERRMEKLQQRLKARTRHDGKARPGFEQNVATIRAEMEMLSTRAAMIADSEETDSGE